MAPESGVILDAVQRGVRDASRSTGECDHGKVVACVAQNHCNFRNASSVGLLPGSSATARGLLGSLLAERLLQVVYDYNHNSFSDKEWDEGVYFIQYLSASADRFKRAVTLSVFP